VQLRRRRFRLDKVPGSGLGYTVTAPAGGAVGTASTNITVTPTGTIPSDTVTISISGAAQGSVSSSTLSWSDSGAEETLTYTPARPGEGVLTITSAQGYAVLGSPVTYTATQSGWAPPIQTNVAANTGATTATQSCAFASDVEVGDFIVVGVVHGGSVTVSSVTDSAGNVYIPLSPNVEAGSGFDAPLRFYGAISTSATALEITVTLAADDFPNVVIADYYYPGLVGFTVDGAATLYGGSGSPAQCGPINGTVASDLLLGLVQIGAATTWSSSGSSTLVTSSAYSNGHAYGLAFLDQVNTTPGTVEVYCGTTNTTATWNCLGVPITANTTPALTTVGYLARSGQNLYFFATTTSNGVLQVITGVNATPTIYKNGVAVSNVQGPFWTSSSQTAPFVVYQLPAPALATDVFTYTAPYGWYATASGGAPIAAGAAIGNYTGQLEPGVGSMVPHGSAVAVPGFALPADPTLQVGFNMGSGANGYYGSYYSVCKNWLHRSYWINVATHDSAGHPQTLSATATNNFSAINAGNLVDSRTTPTPTGIWTFVADETSPLSPMTVSLSTYPGSCTIVSSTTPAPVPVVNGVAVGKTWTWDVEYTDPANPSEFDISLTLSVSGTGAGGSGAWTLQNERMIPPLCNTSPPKRTTPTNPAQSVVLGDPYQAVGGSLVSGTYALDQNTVNWLSTANGRGPATLRWVDCTLGGDGISGVALPAQLRGVDDWAWSGNLAVVSVTEVRAYSLATSPYVWFPEQYPGCSAVGGGPTPYAISPSSISYLNFSGAGTGWFVGEIVCASAHNYTTGQVITLNPEFGATWPNFTITNGEGTLSFNPNSQPPVVWVTSATTFAFTLDGGCTSTAGQSAGINNVASTQTLNGGGTVYCGVTAPDPGALPIELQCATVNQWPGCALWLNVPMAASDACSTTMAQRVLAAIDPGHPVIIEVGNEVWSDDQNTIIAYSLALLGVFGGGETSWEQAYVQMVARHDAIFLSVFNAAGRGSQIVRMFGSSLVNNLTGTLVSAVNTYNTANPSTPIQMDAVAIAPYIDAPSDTSLTAAAASVYSTVSGSSQYGNSYPWTRKMWLEYLRHWVKYQFGFVGPGGYVSQHLAALKEYTPVNSQGAGFVPALYCYEGSWEEICPNIGNATVTGQLAHDLMYDPEYRYAYWAYYEMVQYGGASLINVYDLCMMRLTLYGGAIPLTWGIYQWAGQVPGTGDGTDGKAVNRFFVNTGVCEDAYNVVPGGLAWQDWASIANQASSSNRRRWFPGLRSPRTTISARA
jgi:hypothetical protein